MNENEVQVNQEPQEEQPDLTGVEIVSNGAKVPTEEPKAEDKQTETPKQETSKEPPAEQKELQEAKEEQKEIKQELSSKGLDYAKLEESYLKNGKLTEDDYKQLEDVGYPKAVVNAMLAGWQAKADAFVSKVIEDAGGKREFDRIQKFVTEQGQSAIDAFNEIVEKSDLNVVSAYITGVKAQMVAKYGTTNPTLAGSNSSNSGVKGYKDASELVKAMSDPRYAKGDPDYIKEVEQKVAKSTFF